MKSHRLVAGTAVTAVALILVAPVPGKAADPGGRSTPVPGPPRPVEIVVRDERFAWVDAAVGAAATLGFVSLVTGAIRLKHAKRPNRGAFGRQEIRKET